MKEMGGMESEMFRSESLPSQGQLDWLVARGVTGREVVEVLRLPEPCLLHAGNIRFEQDCFSFDPDGQPAFILAVWNGGQVEELVAWTEREFAPLLGWKFALSEFLLREPVLSDDPLPIYRHPLTWLQNRGDGLVILNKTRAFYELATVDRLLVEDVRHGESIRRMLNPPRHKAKILVRAEAVAA